VQTAYQVGKGFVDKVTGSPEAAAESKAGAGEAPGEPVEESLEEPVEESPEEPVEESPEEPVETSEETGADEAGPADPGAEIAPEAALEEAGEKAAPEEKAPVRHRMRFRLAEE
jgi:hypothetical protein